MREEARCVLGRNVLRQAGFLQDLVFPKQAESERKTAGSRGMYLILVM
jgi:hypothetical protein